MYRSSLSLTILLALLLACSCPATEQSGNLGKPKAPLVFKLSGRAEAAPDTVIVRFVLVGDGDTLDAAEQQLQKTSEAVVAAIQKQGIKPADMQMERFAAMPLQPSGIRSSSALQPLGYRIQRQYKILLPLKTGSMDKALKAAGAALGQGGRPVSLPDGGYDSPDARQSSLLEFTVSEPKKLLHEAMANALKDARSLAEQAGKEMGYSPGAVRLAGVRSSFAGVDPNRYDSVDSSRISSLSWQSVGATVTIEAEYELIRI